MYCKPAKKLTDNRELGIPIQALFHGLSDSFMWLTIHSRYLAASKHKN